MIVTGPENRPLRLAYVEDDPEAARRLIDSWKAHRMTNPFDTYLSAGALCSELAAPFPRTPDVIIIDLTLPDMHGTELIKLLRAEPRLAHIPLFIVTSSDRETAEQNMALSQAEGYALKPVLAPNLLDLLMDIKRERPRFGLELVKVGDGPAIAVTDDGGGVS